MPADHHRHRLIALDLGTRTGWAVADAGEVIASGTWNLAPSTQSRFEGGGMRFLRFERLLLELLGTDAGEVAFEEVRRHAGTSAAHVYGGLLAVLTSTCEKRGLPYRGIPVGTIKRVATGKGNAGKSAMIDAARVRWPLAGITDDNEADARWIAEAATRGA